MQGSLLGLFGYDQACICSGCLRIPWGSSVKSGPIQRRLTRCFVLGAFSDMIKRSICSGLPSRHLSAKIVCSICSGPRQNRHRLPTPTPEPHPNRHRLQPPLPKRRILRGSPVKTGTIQRDLARCACHFVLGAFWL